MGETNDIGALQGLVHSLLAEVERLRKRVHELESQNADLTARLAQSSSNSHKPPSSDGYRKKPLIKPALPNQTGKKPGGQAGHPGQTLEMVQQPDLIHRHQATHCGQCGLALAERAGWWPVGRSLTCPSPGCGSRSTNWWPTSAAVAVCRPASSRSM
ncbi:DUF6444 domain-containing protein [Telluribacter sp.]|uniref:DUF6444 domain-containing protein n=1 Tax=Telluribacter sp. TaxID=1978767 RepID=UPI002E0FC74C|nr:DUF6444 domain-containing protein [Telluribacter sp.]